MPRIASVLTVFLLALAGATAASATLGDDPEKPVLIATLDPVTLKPLLEAAAIKVLDGKDNLLVLEVSGFKALVMLGNDGTTLQFRAGFAWKDKPRPEKLDLVNKWNAQHRFGRVFLDAKDDPAISLDLDVTGGVSRRNLDEQLKLYRVLVLRFAAYLRGDGD